MAPFGRSLALTLDHHTCQAGLALMAQGEKEGKPYLYRWPATLPSIPKLSTTLPLPDSTRLVCGHWA